MPTLPKDSPCLYCGKLYTRRSIYEHERHSCPHNRKRVKRSYGTKKCPVCGKAYHAAGLRAHMATQHPHAFIAEKARRKPSSRAAQRREMVDSSRARAGKKHEQQPEKRKDSHKPSPPQHAPTRRSEESRPSSTEELRPGKHKQAHRSTESRADGSPSKRAWSVMRQKMSEAASR
jgi:hypothetical protein